MFGSQSRMYLAIKIGAVTYSTNLGFETLLPEVSGKMAKGCGID